MLSLTITASIRRAFGAQLARQKAWQRQGHFVGLGVVQALGLLDRTRLAGKRVLEIGAGECMLEAKRCSLRARAKCGRSMRSPTAVGGGGRSAGRWALHCVSSPMRWIKHF